MYRMYKTKILLIVFVITIYILCLEYRHDQLKSLLSKIVQNAQIEQCDKVNNVVFLKTHKCASSSIQNILLRYGEKNNLNFAVPRSGHQLYGTKWQLVGDNYKNMSYNLFLMHARFNYGQISEVMGNTNRSTYITMIRDPVDIFVSAWHYYKLGGSYKLTLDEFARSPPNVTKRKAGKMLGPNQLLWDLGVDNVYNEEDVKRKIAEIDKRFHLVMILEQFEESLILMKDRLCWSADDIKNLKLNARKVDEGDEISAETRQLLEAIMAPDYEVYNHFLAKFRQQLDTFGPGRMAEELAELERVNTEITEQCDFVEKDNNNLGGVNKWWGPARLVGYLAENADSVDEECRLMTMAELSYINRVREAQAKKYPKKK